MFAPVRASGKFSFRSFFSSQSRNFNYDPSVPWADRFFLYAFPGSGGSGTITWSIPALKFEQELGEEPLVAPDGEETMDAGLIRLFRDPDPRVQLPRVYPKIWGILMVYQNLIEFHARFLESMVTAGRVSEYFEKLYVRDSDRTIRIRRYPGGDRQKSYTINFTSSDSPAFGGPGGLFLWDLNYPGDDANGVPGHEFGHSLNAAFAPGAFDADDDFAGGQIDSNGRTRFRTHSGEQYQGLATAFNEGLASTLSQYLINGCNGRKSDALPRGGADPFGENQWNVDPGCDRQASCSYHNFRFHMNERNVPEDGAEWNRRLKNLRELNRIAEGVGHRFVLSNNEIRYAQFGCDILDDDPRTGYHAALVAANPDRRYLEDFTFQVARILDGVDLDSEQAAELRFGTIESSPATENVRVALPDFLDAMEDLCPGDCRVNYLPPRTDFSNPAVNETLNSAHYSVRGGVYAPRVLLERLVRDGHARRAEASDLFILNHMETVPLR